MRKGEVTGVRKEGSVGGISSHQTGQTWDKPASLYLLPALMFCD